jgi:hypothetical protein
LRSRRHRRELSDRNCRHAGAGRAGVIDTRVRAAVARPRTVLYSRRSLSMRSVSRVLCAGRAGAFAFGFGLL